MARVNSPTQNLYALLAEPEIEPKRAPAKARAAKRPQEKEETPKERAAARAIENAAKNEKKKAEREKVKQAAEEAERLKQAAAEFDDSGFTQQRLQRVKQAKATKRTPEEEAQASKGQKQQGDFKPKQKKPFKEQGQVGGQVATGDAQKKDATKQGPKQGGNKPPRFDKHSNNPKTGKKSVAAKDGAGKANWGKTPSAKGTAEATVAAAGGTTVDEWDEAGVTVPSTAPAAGADPVEGAAPVEGAQAEAPAEKKPETEEEKEAKEDAKLLTLDSYLAIKAEKQKALEALVGGTKGHRELTDEEKKSLSKFTVLENQKNKKPEAPAAAAATTTTTTTPAPAKTNVNARKGEISVAVDQVFHIKIRDNRRGGRGGRGGRGAAAAAPASGHTHTEAAENKQETASTGSGAAAAPAGRGGNRGGRGRKKQPYSEAYPQLGSPLKV